MQANQNAVTDISKDESVKMAGKWVLHFSFMSQSNLCPCFSLTHSPSLMWQCEGFEPTGQNSSGEDEIRSAACDLVCEWAQKVLSRQFVSVEDLARFLLNSHYISTKSVAALTVMTGSPSGMVHLSKTEIYLNTIPPPVGMESD